MVDEFDGWTDGWMEVEGSMKLIDKEEVWEISEPNFKAYSDGGTSGMVSRSYW